MPDKIKHIITHRYVQQFRDVRALGLLVFGVIALLVSWSSVGVIQANYELQKQIGDLEQQNQVKQLENTNLAFVNEYYNTEDYLELQAREQFGLVAPGEELFLVPKEVALKRVPELEKEDDTVREAIVPVKPAYQRNIEAWADFLLRGQLR